MVATAVMISSVPVSHARLTRGATGTELFGLPPYSRVRERFASPAVDVWECPQAVTLPMLETTDREGYQWPRMNGSRFHATVRRSGRWRKAWSRSKDRCSKMTLERNATARTGCFRA